MNSYKSYVILFIVMVIVGIIFNPMNVLAYQFNHIYFSYTLFYIGLFMASNMLWAHDIISYLSFKKFNIYIFILGVFLSLIISILFLREQYLVDDNQWLKRMITHHSTALTTSNKILNRTNNKKIRKLAEEIILTQEKEIKLMKSLL